MKISSSNPGTSRRLATMAALSFVPLVGLGCVSPSLASAAPAPAPASVDSTTTSPRVASGEQREGWFETKGTSLTFRNDTGKNVWVRHYRYAGEWRSPIQLAPGATRTYDGNWPGTDDVELRVFKSEEAAKDNSVFKAYEIDAENPAYSSPWISVSYMNRYFGVGDTTTWYGAGWLGDAEFWGKRHDDTSRYKQFELHMKSMG